MGNTTFYAEAETSGTYGTQLRGTVMISARGKDVSDFGYEIGDAIVEAIEAAVFEYEPVDDSQPLSGEVLEELTQIAIVARTLVSLSPRKRDAASAAEEADSMIAFCGEGLKREPRFAQAYAYALAMRSQDTERRLVQMRAAVADVLPKPIKPTGNEARVMRVEIHDFKSEKLKDSSGRVRVGMTTKHTPMTGKQAKKQVGQAAFFPLPLFDDKQLGSRVETQFSVHGMLVAVVIETAKPAYGLLREVLLAVEEAVEDYKLLDAA